MPKVVTFEIVGTLIHKFDVQQITETFSKRDIVVRVDHEQYPQEVKLTCVGPAKSAVEHVPIGVDVVCHCELTGRSYQKKTDGSTDWFTSVKCFVINQTGSGLSPTKQQEIEDVPF